LKAIYPEAPVLDLLSESEYQEFLRQPGRLEAWVDANIRASQPLIIDGNWTERGIIFPIISENRDLTSRRRH